ncbi:MAG: sigma-70 family RNA polymerase sigma factor [Mycobacteriaceae bacterium]|nr:sigma-70 family RNA polymerase sigma factor [Mycobacteriaceae bacterium]
MSGGGLSAADAAGRTFRQERAAVLATLIRSVGDIQLAEDALQDAFVDAMSTWPRDGIPAKPGAWITTTARRRAIDRIRRHNSQRERDRRLAVLADREAGADDAPAEPDDIVDDRLRLIFTCCHPALDPTARIALTLRMLGGLGTGDIARAFLVTEPTMGKRIVRAKRKIAAANIPYRVPSPPELPGRLRGVLRVLYLIFNEGYSATAGEHLVRIDLCDEAIRLSRLLAELMPDEPEAWGLLALMLLLHGRSGARTDDYGRFVAPADQDRTRWSPALVAEGTAALRRARSTAPGEYQLQAAIAASHIPDSAGNIDWAAIAALYAALADLTQSQIVYLNHAAAVSFSEGPHAGLKLLTPLLSDPALARYQPLHAVHADLAARAGDDDTARHAYQRAIDLTSNAVERGELRHRLDQLGKP